MKNIFMYGGNDFYIGILYKVCQNQKKNNKRPIGNGRNKQYKQYLDKNTAELNELKRQNTNIRSESEMKLIASNAYAKKMKESIKEKIAAFEIEKIKNIKLESFLENKGHKYSNYFITADNNNKFYYVERKECGLIGNSDFIEITDNMYYKINHIFTCENNILNLKKIPQFVKIFTFNKLELISVESPDYYQKLLKTNIQFGNNDINENYKINTHIDDEVYEFTFKNLNIIFNDTFQSYDDNATYNIEIKSTKSTTKKDVSYLKYLFSELSMFFINYEINNKNQNPNLTPEQQLLNDIYTFFTKEYEKNENNHLPIKNSKLNIDIINRDYFEFLKDYINRKNAEKKIIMDTLNKNIPEKYELDLKKMEEINHFLKRDLTLYNFLEMKKIETFYQKNEIQILKDKIPILETIGSTTNASVNYLASLTTNEIKPYGGTKKRKYVKNTKRYTCSHSKRLKKKT